MLIRPDLKDDPIKAQGKIGFIQYAPKSMDGLYVSLLGEQDGFYKPDELLRMKGKHEIFKDLMENGTSLDANDFKTLYKISLLQDRGTTSAEIQALELARDNPSVWPRTLESLAPKQNLELARTYGR